MVARARAVAPAAGLIITASSSVDREARSLLRRHADVCYVGADAAPVIAAIRERLRLSGLADEMGERVKSLIADGRTISFSGFREKPHQLSVLVAGKPSPLTLSACNAIRKVATQVSCVFSAGQVMRALDHSHFDCAIFHPTGETDLLIALARALRRHRDHRKLSVFLTSEDDELLDRCSSRDGFDSIIAGHLASDLAHRLDIAARRARMASSMREFLQSKEGCGGGKDGAAGARFFAHHAVRVFRRADETGTPISLAALSLEPHNSEGAQDAAEAALDDALRTATKLVRAEDLIAKLTPTTLIFMLRGARACDAVRVAERLQGVISGTLLRSTLEIASVAAAGVERRPGDDIETMVASVIRTLRITRNAKTVAV
jgi:PleD family two-component response regulator